MRCLPSILQTTDASSVAVTANADIRSVAFESLTALARVRTHADGPGVVYFIEVTISSSETRRMRDGSDTQPVHKAPRAPTRQPFQLFLDEHREPVLSFLRATVGPDDAEDCFQETFIAALRAYGRMDGAHPRAWLMTIARRKAIDHHRASARRPIPQAELPEQPVSAEPPDRAVWSAVARLSDSQRTAVALRYAADLPYAEIAASLGCSEQAARRRVADGLENLRATVEKEEW